MRDVTLGQYITGDSPLHRLDPRVKLLLTVVFIIVIFTFQSLAAMAAAFLLLLALYALVRIPLKMLLRSLKPILPIVLFTAVLNLFFVAGDPVFQIWKLTVTRQGLLFAAMLSLRIVALLAGSSLLTYTTTPIALTGAIELLLAPFAKLGLPVHELAMMMTIALRFIPTLLDETDKIMAAQKSRGANLDTGKFTERIRALTPILVPLFVSAFRRADELALAMECRCYTGGSGRTRMKELRFGKNDLLAVLLFAAVCTALCVLDARL